MKKTLFVILTTGMLLFSGCNLIVPASRHEELQKMYEQQQADNEQLQAQLSQLQEQYAALEGNVAQSAEPSTVDPFDEKILGSLFLRPDLIPVGGEEMRYFTDLCRILSERYTYAYAEDGRNAVDMILSYTLREDGTYAWNLEVYNTGSGWQLNESGEQEASSTADTTPQNPDTGKPSTAPSSPASASSIDESAAAPATPSTASSDASSSAVSKPAVTKPIPNEAQQQKFREIASLLQ